jgi:mannose-6-phosphate isomerase-like protein (cupin superfamily)
MNDMPVVRANTEMPVWSKLRRYSTYEVAPDQELRIPAEHPNARLLTMSGMCIAKSGRRKTALWPQQFLDAELGSDGFFVVGTRQHCKLMLFEGTWPEGVGACGVYEIFPDAANPNKGDPFDYPKSTNFDSHYHDFDEYWMILAGRCEVVIGPTHFDAGPGDCVVLGLGHHHDITKIDGSILFGFFQTLPEGAGRSGHLWEHTHGKAHPDPARL